MHEAPLGYYEYWEDAMQELKSIKPQFKMGKVDNLCTSWRNGFMVEMKSIGSATIRAINLTIVELKFAK